MKSNTIYLIMLAVASTSARAANLTSMTKKMQSTAENKLQQMTRKMHLKARNALYDAAYAAQHPLQAAVSKNNFAKVQQLIDAGADVSQPDGDDNPLFMAQTPEMMRFLLNHGANPNAESEAWGHVLSWTILLMNDDERWASASPELVSLLIAKGADVNATDTWHAARTALQCAIWNNRPEIVKLLVQAGADVNAKDYNERTALDLAKSAETKKLLIDAGAKKGTDLP